MNSPGWLAFPAVWTLILVVSAAAKLRAREDTLSALQVLPLPAALRTRAVAVGLPVVEIALAVALVAASGRVFMVVASALCCLALGYLAVVTVILRRGESTRCACFGALSGGEVTAATLVRNLLLLAGAVATLAWALAGHCFVDTIRDRGAEAVTVLAGVAWTAAVCVLLGLRQTVVGSYERRPIPEATLIGPDGPVDIRVLAATQARLLIFLSRHCGPCHEVAQDIPRWTRELWPVALHAVVKDDAAADDFAFLAPVLMQVGDDETIISAFEITGTPAAVLLGSDGLVAGGPVAGSAEVGSLIESIIGQLDPAHPT